MKHRELGKVSGLLLVLWSFWGWIFKETVFENQMLIYLILLVLLFLYAGLLVRNIGKTKISACAVAWYPFFIWSIIGFIINGKVENYFYWFICLSMLTCASTKSMDRHFPMLLIVLSGIITIVGIVLEMLFPSIYMSYVFPLFSDFRQYRIEGWQTNESGFAGFMCQLDRAAMPIIWLEGLIICFYREKIKKHFNADILLFITILFVILTGKRMASVVAIIVPLLVLLLKQKQKTKTLLYLILGGFVLLIGIALFVSNLDYFSQLGGFSRMVEAYVDYQQGRNISDARVELNAIAWRQFYESPIWGVGMGNYGGGNGMSSHNMYMKVLAEMGILGFILFVIPLFVCTRELIKSAMKTKDKTARPYIYYALFAQFVFMFCGYSENGISDLFIYMIYFTALAAFINKGQSSQDVVRIR